MVVSPCGPSTGGGHTDTREKGAPYRSAPWVRPCYLSCFCAVRSLQQMSFLEFFLLPAPPCKQLWTTHHYPRTQVGFQITTTTLKIMFSQKPLMPKWIGRYQIDQNVSPLPTVGLFLRPVSFFRYRSQADGGSSLNFQKLLVHQFHAFWQKANLIAITGQPQMT